MQSNDKLATVYENALNRIQGQNPGDRHLARQMLAWVVESKGPLTRQEFLHALAVQVGSPALRKEYIVEDLGSAVAPCAGLIVFNERSNTVHLMHHTTRTYFEDPRHRPEWMAEFQETIACACISYLSYSAFAAGPCRDDGAMDERLDAYPFLPYAAQHWGSLGRDEGAQMAAVEALALVFLTDEGKLASANQAMQFRGRRPPGYSSWYDGHVAAVHIVAQFRMEDVAVDMTALHLATAWENEDIVHVLMSKHPWARGSGSHSDWSSGSLSDGSSLSSVSSRPCSAGSSQHGNWNSSARVHLTWTL